MSYTLEFKLEGLPQMTNQILRGHWRVKYGASKLWKMKVFKACWHLKPSEPLKKARLTLTRVSAREPDLDGLVSGFKHVIDGLVRSGIIIDDRPSVITADYKWEKGPPRGGFIKVKVEEVL